MAARPVRKTRYIDLREGPQFAALCLMRKKKEVRRMHAGIILISGACGTGKTTVARLLAEQTGADRAVHLHTDDFYGYIRKGYVPPWQAGSKAQNETAVAAAAAAAEQFAAGGFEVYVDGVIGPWLLASWRGLSARGLDVRYIVLRPDAETAVRRASARPKNAQTPLEADVVRKMCGEFADLGPYEANAVDTSAQTPADTAQMLCRLLRQGGFRL